MNDYAINIFYSEEDGGHIGDIPDLELCSAIGPTAQEALEEVIDAKQLWLEEAEAKGRSFPDPRGPKQTR